MSQQFSNKCILRMTEQYNDIANFSKCINDADKSSTTPKEFEKMWCNEYYVSRNKHHRVMLLGNENEIRLKTPPCSKLVNYMNKTPEEVIKICPNMKELLKLLKHYNAGNKDLTSLVPFAKNINITEIQNCMPKIRRFMRYPEIIKKKIKNKEKEKKKEEKIIKDKIEKINSTRIWFIIIICILFLVILFGAYKLYKKFKK